MLHDLGKTWQFQESTHVHTDAKTLMLKTSWWIPCPPFDLPRLTRGVLDFSPWKELPAPKKQKGEESSPETWWKPVDAWCWVQWCLKSYAICAMRSLLSLSCKLFSASSPFCVHVIQSDSNMFTPSISILLKPFPASTCVCTVPSSEGTELLARLKELGGSLAESFTSLLIRSYQFLSHLITVYH